MCARLTQIVSLTSHVFDAIRVCRGNRLEIRLSGVLANTDRRTGSESQNISVLPELAAKGRSAVKNPLNRAR